MKIDLGEALGLAPDVVELFGLILKAKKSSSPGGKKMTPAEKERIREKVEEILREAAVDAID